MITEKPIESVAIRGSGPPFDLLDNSGKFSNFALVQPETMTKHDRHMLTICEAGCLRQLEVVA
jgi:hypothetical protein